jgi:hypothetical protein
MGELNKWCTKNIKGDEGLQAKSLLDVVTPHGAGDCGFKVVSGQSGETYYVTRDRRSGIFFCTCKWGQKRNGGGCHHVMAAKRFLEAEKGRTASFFGSEEAAKRQRRPAEVVAEGWWDDRVVIATSRKA